MFRASQNLEFGALRVCYVENYTIFEIDLSFICLMCTTNEHFTVTGTVRIRLINGIKQCLYVYGKSLK